MKSWCLAFALLWSTQATTQPRYLVVDLGDAYTDSTALAGLIAKVDVALKSIAKKRRPEVVKLRAQIAELKTRSGDTREQQLAIARRIEALDAAAEHAEELLAIANQSAIERVNDQIAKIKTELAAEVGARWVLDVQETQYVREGCACDYTRRLYALLNERMPEVSIEFPPAAEPST